MKKIYNRPIDLDHLNITGAGAGAIIQNEFDNFLHIKDIKNRQRNKRRIYIFFALILIAGIGYYLPSAIHYSKDKLAYFSTSKIVTTLNIYGYEIKQPFLSH